MSDRISFGRLHDVLPIPDLIEIQTNSYDEFLQKDVPADKREYKGLQEVFKDTFPSDPAENTSGLEFLSYRIDDPKIGIVDCLKDGGFYQGALYATFRLHLPQKAVKEETVHLCDIPLMTPSGSFVISGAERVIVSQLHRSPGVCFEKVKHASGRDLYSYKIIADHGSWLEVQYDSNNLMYIYLDRKRRRRKFLISTFLRAFGMQSDREVLDAVYSNFYLRGNNHRATIDSKGNLRVLPMFSVPSGKPTEDESDILDLDQGKGLICPHWLGVKDVPLANLQSLDPDDLSRVYTVGDVCDPADPDTILIESLTSLSPQNLDDAKEYGIETIAAVDTAGMGDSIIRCVLHEHKELGQNITPEDARKRIYSILRPTDQATDNNAKLLFSRTFEDSRRYDLGRVGRYRLIMRLFQSPLDDMDNLYSDDDSDEENRKKWGKLTLRQIRNNVAHFQSLLDDFAKGGRNNLEDEFILRNLFLTPEVAVPALFDLGAENGVAVDKAAVAEVWNLFLDANKINDVARNAGGLFAEYLKNAQKSLENLVKTSFGEEGEAAQKLAGALFKTLASSKRNAIVSFLRGEDLLGKKDAKDADLRARVSEFVRSVMRETVSASVAIFQDYLKSRRYLTKADIAASTAYLMRLTQNVCSIDDIDHLGRRRIRTIGELLQNQCRLGLSRMNAAFREKFQPQDSGNNTNVSNPADVSISRLLNPKPLASVIREFFQRNQLSQFMDQTNCLSELTNKRRLSALGPGGLTRERAGFEVRDVHPSHYGRVCPIETPEGPNIGLISSLALYAKIDDFGFINTPYRRVVHSHVTNEIEYLTADREENYIIAQANAPQDAKGNFVNPKVLARFHGEPDVYDRDRVNFIDVSPKQMISAAAGLIPFLEHDDANRALMGANMQRQAVPLLKAQRPIIGTGLEEVIAKYSRAVVSADEAGIVASSTAERIIVTPDGKLPVGFNPDAKKQPAGVKVYNLYKFLRSNASTFINQHPIVKRGDKVEKGQALADGACTDQGELALGRNVNVAYMSWHGYNYEDAIIISEKLVSEDVYTSIHVSLEDVQARDTKLGPEVITHDIPNQSEEKRNNLDVEGVIRVGAEVKPGDVLVGKATPKNETDLAPEERLLKAIFGEKMAEVKDTSLVVPGGLSGVVMDVRCDRKQEPGRNKEGKSLKSKLQEVDKRYAEERDAIISKMVEEFNTRFTSKKLAYPISCLYATGETEEIIAADRKITHTMLKKLAHHYDNFQMHDCPEKTEIEGIIKNFKPKLENNEKCRLEEIELTKKDDAGQNVGPIRAVKVYIASKRKISVGDKMAGRHGNKGIVSKIVPVEDMPYMADGTPLDIILNPLGVPSRMNIGQVFETNVGWAARILGMVVATPVFDGVPESKIFEMLATTRKMKVEEQGWTIDENNHVRDKQGFIRDDCFIGEDGKVRLWDGRTGEPFDQRILVGTTYMLKLDHLVANKIHARAVGHYSLVTQQPLGGKAQHGGQRFGEMEVWALEAYGAAYTLQEMLTVKSDDVNGRNKFYEAIMRGDDTLKAGMPESFNVLMREMMSLCLNVQLKRQKPTDE
ncbi:MAG: DNA-directed RNA polymerase subunit beta [Victivallales bacterium]|nr:DNA-directed RNA polymerase subunit beta [Victivallales bacterium]